MPRNVKIAEKVKAWMILMHADGLSASRENPHNSRIMR